MTDWSANAWAHSTSIGFKHTSDTNLFRSRADATRRVEEVQVEIVYIARASIIGREPR
jgi:hypothetical protein